MTKIRTSRSPGHRGWGVAGVVAAGVAAALLAGPGGPTRSAEDGKGDAAARKQSRRNLTHIALAFNNYAGETRGRFPPAALYGKDGKPLLSWRVLLLPQLQQSELYKQFKLDEPWDSANNKKLLVKMPKVYAAPKAGVKKGYTYYQVFVGPETPFTGKTGPLFPATFTDGTANTLLVVEAGEAVPWTSPRDVNYSPKKPLPKLGGVFPDGFHTALADGSTKFFKKGKVSEQTTRNAIGPSDGTVLGNDFPDD